MVACAVPGCGVDPIPDDELGTCDKCGLEAHKSNCKGRPAPYTCPDCGAGTIQ